MVLEILGSDDFMNSFASHLQGRYELVLSANQVTQFSGPDGAHWIACDLTHVQRPDLPDRFSQAPKQKSTGDVRHLMPSSSTFFTAMWTGLCFAGDDELLYICKQKARLFHKKDDAIANTT